MPAPEEAKELVGQPATLVPPRLGKQQERVEAMARFFIDRPVLGVVISAVILLAGLAAVKILPIAQYPEITPPTVQVSCSYPGASAKVVRDTVAAPIEQEVNGVERMLYMSSQSTNDGGYNLTVTFELGTNLDMAQVLVQNRVNLAMPPLARRGEGDRRLDQEEIAQHFARGEFHVGRGPDRPTSRCSISSI